VATSTTTEDTMSARTVYGYFSDFELSANTPADVVTSYINGAGPDWYERAVANGAFQNMVDDYTAEIQAALPEGVLLSGSELTGPYSSCNDPGLKEKILTAITEVDLEEIVKRHDFE
jgi:hypothetical protein